MEILPLEQTDFYKTTHYKMYPKQTLKIYSNETGRKSRIPGVTHFVVFSFQAFIIETLIEQWNRNFFTNKITKFKYRLDENGNLVASGMPRHPIEEYKRLMDNTLGEGVVGVEHLYQLHALGYLPLEIKVLPEGTLCPIGVPFMTITNTVPHAYWLVNYLETIISCQTWQGMVSATIANEYKKVLRSYAMETVGEDSFVQWQGHDFSMRGMSSLESACISGAGSLLSFTGTDTVPAISFLETFYGADVEEELVGSSVPATEHSVMCMGGRAEGEKKTLLDHLKLFPYGPLSEVMDTWDLWWVLTVLLLDDEVQKAVKGREGKLVIRPDSGDPVDIICGDPKADPKHPAFKGVIQLLYEAFGGEKNKKGYIQLDPHIGAIYGDSITLDRARSICERLKAKGFASTNVVLGIGSYTYQYNTRDTLGFAVKATYGEVLVDNKVDARNLFKDPVTDDGTKRSAKGLLMVDWEEVKGKKELVLYQEVPKTSSIKGAPSEDGGALETVFLDGKLKRFQTLSEIRALLNSQNS